MDSGTDQIGAGRETPQPQARATLDAWRARGADRVNPMRFRFIDALARRAEKLEGNVRRVLEERLATLITGYSGEVERAEAAIKADAEPSHAADATDAAAIEDDIPVDAARTNHGRDSGNAGTASHMRTQPMPRPSPLAELVDLLTNRAAAGNESEAPGKRDALDFHWHHRGRSPDLPVLDYFRETWSKFSTEKTLRQSLEQVPDNAGPLNSNSLIHRSLSLMRELSPGYLQQFLSYVEALSWLEQLSASATGAAGAAGAAAATAPAAAPAVNATRASNAKGSAKKGARGKGSTR